MAVGLGIVIVGYIVWWLIALGWRQTPGKQVVGIRVIKDSGEPSDWGYTFLREFVIKFLLMGLFLFLHHPRHSDAGELSLAAVG